MEYPFKFKYHSRLDGVTYTASDVYGKLVVSWVDVDGRPDANPYYTFSEAEQSVENGLWIVQEPELEFPFYFKAAYGDDELYCATIVDGKLIVSWEGGGVVDGYAVEAAKQYIKDGSWIIQKPVEAPPEPSKVVSTLTIQVEAKVALEAVKELTEALNELVTAYEKLNAVQSGFMKGVGNV